MSLLQLAEDIGLKTERRLVPIDELDSFDEVGACGTAAVISPIKEIYDIETKKIYSYCKDGKAGPISKKLYDMLVDIQFGDAPDKHGWVEIVE
jgi:branched-chain amino acid aminotransferase